MNFDAWIGRPIETTDVLTPGLVRRYVATIGGDTDCKLAPLGIHWCLGLPDAAMMELGEDGHPQKGGFLPPIELPRRMWASSKVDFVNSLTAGARIRRISEIQSVTPKQGGSGKLVFVEVVHQTFANDELCIQEVQTIVYREASDTILRLPEEKSETVGQSENVICPTPQLLFRYSALTFNSHRIHYDESYAKNVEGYPRLVVHGPLMASLLLRAASDAFGADNISSFKFRGQAPAYCGQRLRIKLDALENNEAPLAVIGPDGRAVMSAAITLNQN